MGRELEKWRHGCNSRSDLWMTKNPGWLSIPFFFRLKDNRFRWLRCNTMASPSGETLSSPTLFHCFPLPAMKQSLLLTSVQNTLYNLWHRTVSLSLQTRWKREPESKRDITSQDALLTVLLICEIAWYGHWFAVYLCRPLVENLRWCLKLRLREISKCQLTKYDLRDWHVRCISSTISTKYSLNSMLPLITRHCVSMYFTLERRMILHKIVYCDWRWQEKRERETSKTDKDETYHPRRFTNEGLWQSWHLTEYREWDKEWPKTGIPDLDGFEVCSSCYSPLLSLWRADPIDWDSSSLLPWFRLLSHSDQEAWRAFSFHFSQRIQWVSCRCIQPLFPNTKNILNNQYVIQIRRSTEEVWKGWWRRQKLQERKMRVKQNVGKRNMELEGILWLRLQFERENHDDDGGNKNVLLVVGDEQQEGWR